MEVCPRTGFFFFLPLLPSCFVSYSPSLIFSPSLNLPLPLFFVTTFSTYRELRWLVGVIAPYQGRQLIQAATSAIHSCKPRHSLYTTEHARIQTFPIHTAAWPRFLHSLLRAYARQGSAKDKIDRRTIDNSKKKPFSFSQATHIFATKQLPSRYQKCRWALETRQQKHFARRDRML